jgi:hypothetical protein
MGSFATSLSSVNKVFAATIRSRTIRLMKINPYPANVSFFLQFFSLGYLSYRLFHVVYISWDLLLLLSLSQTKISQRQFEAEPFDWWRLIHTQPMFLFFGSSSLWAIYLRLFHVVYISQDLLVLLFGKATSPERLLIDLSSFSRCILGFLTLEA